MSVLTRLESALEGIVEGPLRRIFRPELRSLEIAHALERAMLDARSSGPSRATVPAHYTAEINPVDFARLAAGRERAHRECASFLERRAHEEGLRPAGMIAVEIVAEDSVPRSFVRARISPNNNPRPLSNPIEGTARLSPVAHSSKALGPLVVITEDGRELRLAASSLSIGRGSDNDLVVRDLRVSRHHARIEPSPDGWIIRDLESTNGTFVAGKKVKQALIDGEGGLSLGGFVVRLRPG